MKIFILLQQRPISHNPKKVNWLYRTAVARQATRAMNKRRLLQGRLYARIIWFQPKPTEQDADNIIKPILDALKTIVFADDLLIGECHVSRINMSLPYSFVGDPDKEIANRLFSLLATKEKDFVLIEVGEAAEQIIRFETLQEKP